MSPLRSCIWTFQIVFSKVSTNVHQHQSSTNNVRNFDRDTFSIRIYFILYAAFTIIVSNDLNVTLFLTFLFFVTDTTSFKRFLYKIYRWWLNCALKGLKTDLYYLWLWFEIQFLTFSIHTAFVFSAFGCYLIVCQIKFDNTYRT